MVKMPLLLARLLGFNFTIKLGRPILKLKMTCHAEALTMPRYHIDPGRLVSPAP